MTTPKASHDCHDIRTSKETIKKLQEEIVSYQEIITIKDDVVMGISNQLAELTQQQPNTDTPALRYITSCILLVYY